MNSICTTTSNPRFLCGWYRSSEVDKLILTASFYRRLLPELTEHASREICTWHTMAPHTRKQHSVASERRRPTEASVFTAFVNCYSERTLCDILGLGRCIAQVFTESVTLNMALCFYRNAWFIAAFHGCIFFLEWLSIPEFLISNIH